MARSPHRKAKHHTRPCVFLYQYQESFALFLEALGAAVLCEEFLLQDMSMCRGAGCNSSTGEKEEAGGQVFDHTENLKSA